MINKIRRVFEGMDIFFPSSVFRNNISYGGRRGNYFKPPMNYYYPRQARGGDYIFDEDEIFRSDYGINDLKPVRTKRQACRCINCRRREFSPEKMKEFVTRPRELITRPRELDFNDEQVLDENEDDRSSDEEYIDVQTTSLPSKVEKKDKILDNIRQLEQENKQINVETTGTGMLIADGFHSSRNEDTDLTVEDEDEDVDVDDLDEIKENDEIKYKLEQIENIRNKVKELEIKVHKITDKGKDYLYCEEMLTKCLLELDDISSNGDEDVRQSRKNVVRDIEINLSILESKAPKLL